MFTIIFTMMFILSLALIFGGYFLIRNEWVYKQRQKLYRKNRKLYKKLLQYDSMLYQYFWVWNVDKFIKKG